MEFAAFGSLQLSAADFEAMTPRELNLRLQAAFDRENREFERIAQLATWLMNIQLPAGSKVTAKQLLGRDRRMSDEF